MATRAPKPAQFQRNALAPGLLAAIALFLAARACSRRSGRASCCTSPRSVRLIVAWFALQAGQWWWTIVFAAVAVLWNPVFPFAFDGAAWTIAQFVVAVAFLAAGALVKVPRES